MTLDVYGRMVAGVSEDPKHDNARQLLIWCDSSIPALVRSIYPALWRQLWKPIRHEESNPCMIGKLNA